MVNRDAYTSTEFLFSDHKYYHHATRTKYKFCCQLLEENPYFSFEKIVGRNETQKTYVFNHAYTRESQSFSKTFKCKECWKTFKHSSNRDRHYQTVHNLILRYECNFCEKVFGRSDNLKRHKEIHKADKVLVHTDEYDKSNDTESSSNSKDTNDSEASLIDFENECGSDYNDDIRESLMDQLNEQLKV